MAKITSIAAAVDSTVTYEDGTIKILHSYINRDNIGGKYDKTETWSAFPDDTTNEIFMFNPAEQFYQNAWDNLVTRQALIMMVNNGKEWSVADTILYEKFEDGGWNPEDWGSTELFVDDFGDWAAAAPEEWDVSTVFTENFEGLWPIDEWSGSTLFTEPFESGWTGGQHWDNTVLFIEPFESGWTSGQHWDNTVLFTEDFEHEWSTLPWNNNIVFIEDFEINWL